ncbi:MAG: SDR family oxidoreductase [Erysipelotrichaceae bacterium]|nr:SDR family oxidoreductase [Erysipelotrichaceae bacterium]
MENRVVIVSGGTKGIGFATAKKFLEKGNKVVVSGRHYEEENMKVLEALGEVKYVKADVSNTEDCKLIVEETIKKFGKVDVLANVAGVVGQRGSFTEVDLDDVAKTININLMGTIALSQYASKYMVEQRKGVIVNVGSICGFMANTEAIGYHASKGGIKMATQAMARELSPYGVRVVSVAPGWVRTGMIDKPIEMVGAALHMKGRIIEPEEIANAIYLMSLDEASAINGTTVMADDGYSSFKGIDGFIAPEL